VITTSLLFSKIIDFIFLGSKLRRGVAIKLGEVCGKTGHPAEIL
jgi:hypothetical protein